MNWDYPCTLKKSKDERKTKTNQEMEHSASIDAHTVSKQQLFPV